MGENIQNRDLLALRQYITAQDETQYSSVHESTVILDLTHSNLQQRHIEIRFSKSDLVSSLRSRIHQKTGTSPQYQHLQVYESGEMVAEIPPETSDDYKLGYFGLLHHGMRVHCMDLNPLSESRNGGYEDTSLVQKYVMTDQDYDRRDNTLRSWGRQQKEQDPTFTLRKHAAEHRALTEAQRQHKLGLPLPDGFVVDSTGQVVKDEPDIEIKPSNNATTVSDEFGPESIQGIQVGQRCQVEPGQRRGRVSFVGEVAQLGGGGYWVGVVFDEPVGQGDGTVQGVRYFDAAPKYGGMVRGKKVQVGDFPERDLFDSEDEL